jgi:SET domain-containing protein 6
MPQNDPTEFLAWFARSGGTLSPDVSIASFDAMGCGGLATADITEDALLFALPRELVLSVHTATLPKLLPAEEWRSVNVGWSGLILCIMFEMLEGERWTPYLDFMPREFDSLMWWSNEELRELQGSYVLSALYCRFV